MNMFLDIIFNILCINVSWQTFLLTWLTLINTFQNHVGKFQYFGRGLPLGHGKRYKELNKTMVCAVTSCTGQYSFQQFKRSQFFMQT